jgi:anti-anti-sigma factor
MATFELKRDSSSLSVLMDGDLTSALVPLLKPEMQKGIEEGVLSVVFDFSKTMLVDSTGIGFLIATYNSLAKKQGGIRIIHASAEIIRLFQSMRLDQRLAISA